MSDLFALAISNLVIWIGIFLYLFYLNKKIKKIEKL